MKATSTVQGQLAEAQACAYLQARGLLVLARNYRWRGGEIDLICRDADYLVFVEVRFRRCEDFGGALSSIDTRKQQRLIRTAQYYLMQQAVDHPVRFDVVALNTETIHWIKDAFSADAHH